MDVALEKLNFLSTEGARQFLLLNLSGKRTEKANLGIYACFIASLTF